MNTFSNHKKQNKAKPALFLSTSPNVKHRPCLSVTLPVSHLSTRSPGLENKLCGCSLKPGEALEAGRVGREALHSPPAPLHRHYLLRACPLALTELGSECHVSKTTGPSPLRNPGWYTTRAKIVTCSSSPCARDLPSALPGRYLI